LEELPPLSTTKLNTTPSFTDSKGYFKIFGLDLRTPENIDEILNPCYRALALKWHPDKNGDDPGKTEKFRSYKPHTRYFQILNNTIVTWLLADFKVDEVEKRCCVNLISVD
jgi:hypothetical protein